MLANISTNVKNANKFLNQNKETVVFIVVTEVFLVHLFSKTKNVANGQKTKEQLKVFFIWMLHKCYHTKGS